MAHQMKLVPVDGAGVYQPTPTHAPTPTQEHTMMTDSLDVEVILSAIPKNYRTRARALINHISADGQHRLQWNGRGELVYHGKVIPGSHITDLLKNSQRQYKHFQPVGQQEFRAGLKELNIPSGLMETRPGPPGIRLSPKKPIQWLNV